MKGKLIGRIILFSRKREKIKEKWNIKKKYETKEEVKYSTSVPRRFYLNVRKRRHCHKTWWRSLTLFLGRGFNSNRRQQQHEQ